MKNKKMNQDNKYSFYTFLLIIVTMIIGGWNNCNSQTLQDTIVLTEFDITPNNSNVDIFWRVRSQVNNDYFTIERSEDCYNWKEVRVVNGSGTINIEQCFVITDYNAYSGISYYRLKQTSFNGKTEIFDPLSINIKKKETIVLNIRPNPVIDYMEVEMDYTTNPDINHDIRIYNSSGKKVYSKRFEDGVNNFIINISRYPSGSYFIVAKSDKFYSESQFIKE